jgi:hypothetical protein
MPVRCGTGRLGVTACGGSFIGVIRAGPIGPATALEAVQQASELGTHRFVVLTAQIAAQLYGHVKGPECGCTGPEDFSDEALRAVAIHRAAGGFASGDEPQAGRIEVVTKSPRDEAPAGHPHTRPEDRFELRGLA